ncbi:Histone deacetylase 11 [Cryptotermes secundus]|uniref:Histone deacetylase 11 n=1 Tax=Cryptotermes secundus TaxID=105785 RepID=A0A2J7PGD7_9NEOP|nr:Histone deacetylase 11 [Cryptotermes secundus]
MGGLCKKRVSDSQESHVSQIYISTEPHQLPIIYREEYNVHFGGIEKLHPFDAAKWGHIFQYLKDADIVNENTVTKPNEVQQEDLLLAHTARYLKSLKWSWNVALIAEIPPLMFVPNFLVQASYLRPMRFQTGGSILAGKLALERGWAINLGGGFHHCSRDKGGGFCPYADITLLVQFLFQYEHQRVKSAMIVDLDAHQAVILMNSNDSHWSLQSIAWLSCLTVSCKVLATHFARMCFFLTHFSFPFLGKWL